MPEISHHEEQVAEGESSGFDIDYTQIEDDGHSQRCEQSNGHPIPAFNERLLDPGLHSFVGLLHETAFLAALLTECLHDPD